MFLSEKRPRNADLNKKWGSSLDQLPHEILIEILMRAGRWAATKMYCTCSKVRTSIRHENALGSRRLISPESGYMLYNEQLDMYRQASAETHKYSSYQSAMSTGKTAIMIMLAIDKLQQGHAVLIVAPVKTYETWMSEFAKFNLNIDSTHPEKSDVLIYHNTHKIHQRYFCAHSATPESLGKKIVWTTFHYTTQMYRLKKPLATTTALPKGPQEVPDAPQVPLDGPNNLMCRSYYVPISCHPELNRFYTSGASIIIVDEAHKFNTRYRGTAAYLLFSASVIVNLWRDVTFRTHIIAQSIAHQHLPPKLNWHNTTTDALSHVWGSQVWGSHKKIIYFGNNSTETIMAQCKKAYGEGADEHVMMFRTAKKSVLSTFANAPAPTILCANYRVASEGLNFNMADAIIFADLHEIAPTTAIQSCGRVIRRNNPNSNVHVYLELPDPNIFDNHNLSSRYEGDIACKWLRSVINKLIIIHGNIPGVAELRKCDNSNMLRTCDYMSSRSMCSLPLLSDLEILLLFTIGKIDSMITLDAVANCKLSDMERLCILNNRGY